MILILWFVYKPPFFEKIKYEEIKYEKIKYEEIKKKWKKENN